MQWCLPSQSQHAISWWVFRVLSCSFSVNRSLTKQNISYRMNIETELFTVRATSTAGNHSLCRAVVEWQTAYKFRLGFPYALGCYIKSQPFFKKKKALNLSVIVCVQCLNNNSGEFFRVLCVKGTHLWLLKWGVSKETLYILLRAEYGNIQEVEESSMLKTVAKTRKSF